MKHFTYRLFLFNKIRQQNNKTDMERIIKTSELVDAVNAAYKKFKGDKDGSVSDLNPDANTKKLAISIILTDGTVIEAGDTDELFALGNLSQIPVASQLLQDNTPEELLKNQVPALIRQMDAAMSRANYLNICP